MLALPLSAYEIREELMVEGDVTDRTDKTSYCNQKKIPMICF